MNTFISHDICKSLCVYFSDCELTGPTCGRRCIDEKGVDVLHSISVIDLRKRRKWLYLSAVIHT